MIKNRLERLERAADEICPETVHDFRIEVRTEGVRYFIDDKEVSESEYSRFPRPKNGDITVRII